MSRLQELRESEEKFYERQNFNSDANRKKQEALFNAQRNEIEKEYNEKILNSQLERKGTGLVGMEKHLLSDDGISHIVSDDTKMNVMSSPIKAPHSNIGTERFASKISNIEDQRLTPIPADLADTKSNITAHDITSFNNTNTAEMNLKSQPDIRPSLSPIPKDDGRSAQASPLTNQQHLSMLQTADDVSADNSFMIDFYIMLLLSKMDSYIFSSTSMPQPRHHPAY